jgi:hypothetical protein
LLVSRLSGRTASAWPEGHRCFGINFGQKAESEIAEYLNSGYVGIL